jgi:hypothetical protein
MYGSEKEEITEAKTSIAGEERNVVIYKHTTL